LALAEATTSFDPSQAQPHMIKLVAYMIKAGGLCDQACWLLAQTPTVHL